MRILNAGRSIPGRSALAARKRAKARPLLCQVKPLSAGAEQIPREFAELRSSPAWSEQIEEAISYIGDGITIPSFLRCHFTRRAVYPHCRE